MASIKKRSLTFSEKRRKKHFANYLGIVYEQVAIAMILPIKFMVLIQLRAKNIGKFFKKKLLNQHQENFGELGTIRETILTL